MQRGKTPIIVGGTGFYLRWFVHGKPNTPAANPEAAQKVSQLLQQVRPVLAIAWLSCTCWPGLVHLVSSKQASVQDPPSTMCSVGSGVGHQPRVPQEMPGCKSRSIQPSWACSASLGCFFLSSC